jgi:hypothetical protein
MEKRKLLQKNFYLDGYLIYDRYINVFSLLMAKLI